MIKFCVQLFALLTLTFVPSNPAFAQHPLVLRKLAEWNDAAPAPAEQIILSEVRNSLAVLYSQNPACRATDISVRQVEPATADRYAFNGRVGGTLRNAWFVIVQIPSCDTAPVRFMVLQKADASLKTIRVNRGTSYAWESLIADTFRSALLGAHIALKRNGLNCAAEEKPIVGVMRIASEESDLGPVQFGVRYKGRWTEIWPIELCGRTAEVGIEFTADGDGGAYTHIVSDQTRVLP